MAVLLYNQRAVRVLGPLTRLVLFIVFFTESSPVISRPP